MTARETNVGIWESTLDGALSSGATTINVTSTTGAPSVPFYVVIDPDDDSKREVILVDDSTTSTSLVLTADTSRGLDGTSDVGHDSGAVVGIYPVPGLWTDINDRVDGKAASDHDHDSDYAATAHDHDEDYSALNHTHDGRYYTETETDGLLDDYLPLAGGTMSGAVVLDGYDEPAVALGNLGSAEEIDFAAGSVQTGTLDDDCTITVTGAPSSGIARPVTLILTQDATGSRAVTWPSGWTWYGESEPSAWAASTEKTITLIPVGSTVRAYVASEV